MPKKPRTASEIVLDPSQILALQNMKRRPEILFKDEVTLESETETIFDEVKLQETENPIRIVVKYVTKRTRVTIVREYDPEKSYDDGIKALTDETNPQE